jgi:Fur family peroxide stress response transcriptional regulator
MQTSLAHRQTKYCQAIEHTLAVFGHATNMQILEELRKSFPDLSATTVHRATSRLALRGSIAIAPSAQDGAMRYDTNTAPHDHFLCASCGILRDTDVKDKVIPILESSIGDCRISGQLTISGLCKNCINN